MPFSATSGQILVTDTGGHVVFDSNQKMFNGTDYVTGSVTFPTRTAILTAGGGGSNADINSTATLASINIAADTVIGSFSASASTAKGVVGLGWFSATGSYVHYHDGIGQSSAPTDRWNLGDFAFYTFIADTGLLKVNERVVLIPPPFTLSGSQTFTVTLESLTLQFKLFCGTFT